MVSGWQPPALGAAINRSKEPSQLEQPHAEAGAVVGWGLSRVPGSVQGHSGWRARLRVGRSDPRGCSRGRGEPAAALPLTPAFCRGGDGAGAGASPGAWGHVGGRGCASPLASRPRGAELCRGEAVWPRRAHLLLQQSKRQRRAGSDRPSPRPGGCRGCCPHPPRAGRRGPGPGFRQEPGSAAAGGATLRARLCPGDGGAGPGEGAGGCPAGPALRGPNVGPCCPPAAAGLPGPGPGQSQQGAEPAPWVPSGWASPCCGAAPPPLGTAEAAPAHPPPPGRAKPRCS